MLLCFGFCLLAFFGSRESVGDLGLAIVQGEPIDDAGKERVGDGAMLCEALYGDAFSLEEREVHIRERVACVVTDCKSLYDAVRQTTPSLSEKGTIIDLSAVRDSLMKDHLMWVPTWAMYADGLTKRDETLRRNLTKFMGHTWVSLRGAQG